MQATTSQTQAVQRPFQSRKDDCEDINISIHSKTRLGKILDPNYIKVINYPVLGKFSSVRSLWHWLHSEEKDDKIRKMVGAALTIYVKENKLYGNVIPNFKAIIGYATWLKLKEYPEQVAELKNLPPDKNIHSYYTHRTSKLPITNSYSSVMLTITAEIRNSLHEDREPNFKFLTVHNLQQDAHYLPPHLASQIQTPKPETSELPG